MRFLFIMATIAIATLVGCTRPAQKPDRNAFEPPTPADSTAPPESSISVQRTAPAMPAPEHPPLLLRTSLPSRSAIVQSAARLVGARTITSQGRRIAYDCAGVARAIFLEHGIDLYRGPIDDQKGNGVRLIYNHVRQHGVVHQGSDVHPGDLVFFDNTWDFNGDGKLNDPLTHVGVVEHSDRDGTVVFISRVADAIARYRMNLSQPHIHKTADGHVLNDYIRRKHPTDPDNAARLTGELFSFYGSLLDPQRSTSLADTFTGNQSRQRASVSAVPER